MSNSIGHNLLHRSLLPSIVLEHQSKINSACIAGNTLFQAQATSLIRNSPLLTEFRGRSLCVRKKKLAMGKHCSVSGFPRAVLATDPVSEVFCHFRDYYCIIFAERLYLYCLFGNLKKKTYLPHNLCNY